MAAASDPDDDFAPGLALLDVAEGCRQLIQRVGALDDRPHLPGLDELSERLEILAPHIGDEEVKRLLQKPTP